MPRLRRAVGVHWIPSYLRVRGVCLVSGNAVAVSIAAVTHKLAVWVRGVVRGRGVTLARTTYMFVLIRMFASISVHLLIYWRHTHRTDINGFACRDARTYTQEELPLLVEGNTCRRCGIFRVTIPTDHTGDTVAWVFRIGVPPKVCTRNFAMHPWSFHHVVDVCIQLFSLPSLARRPPLRRTAVLKVWTSSWTSTKRVS